MPDGYTVNYAYNGKSIAVQLAGGYSEWAKNNGIEGQPAGGDHDFDGLTNLMEYALGLSPTQSNGQPGVLSNNVITFTKGAQAVADDAVTYKIMTSTMLAADSWTEVEPLEDTATVISYQLPTGQPRVFVRLEVEEKN